MYYALYDLQTGDYLHTGRNTASKEELRQALLGYIEPDIEEEERESINKMSVEGLAEGWELRVDTSNEKFSEEE